MLKEKAIKERGKIMENILVRYLLERIIANSDNDKYTIEDNGYEYRLEESNKPTCIFYAREIEFKHILNCIYTLKELLNKDITSEYISSVSAFFKAVNSRYTYSSNHTLSNILNDRYIQSSIFSNLTTLEKQIIITYYISIPKSVVNSGTDSEGNSYKSVQYI